MEQYIPKSAILAEIEKLVDKGKWRKEISRQFNEEINEIWV